jgi:phosphoribosylformimino-5-aminoimidazole carboxamide ribotide isomerase
MLVIPAIDLKDGCVVRLVRGDISDKKIYSREPLRIARRWAAQGAQWLHVVDLDGALCGVPKNLTAAIKISRAVDIPVEFGGGARDLRTIEMLISSGISRVVLGTKAIEDEGFLKKAWAKFKDKIIVSLDVQNARLRTKGWLKDTAEDIFSFAALLKKIGFPQVIYTDIAKDGTLAGANIKNIKSFLRLSGLKVIASGGISCLGEIRRLKRFQQDGLCGVIVGKALYEGRFSLAQAIKISTAP